MLGSNSKKMLPNGRKSSRQFVMALHAIFDHPDYIAMSKQGRAFLWDLARQYDGYNNGNLAACAGIMGRWGWSKSQSLRYRRENEDMGWIEVTRYPRAKREPILYRLTWIATDNWEGRPKLDPGALSQRIRKLS